MSSKLKLIGAAVAVSALVSAGGAFAQAQHKTPAKPAAPAAQQQAPAAGAQGAPGGQPAGPLKVELKPAQEKWTKVCGKDQSVNKEICYTTRDYIADPSQPALLAIAVYDVKGEPEKIVRFLLPIGLMLRSGMRFAIDKGAEIDGVYEICFPNGCFAEAKVKQGTIDAMKKGTNLNVFVKNHMNQVLTFTAPLAGFAEGFDGPAIDPKVLEEEQKKMAEQLQKEAEKRRAEEAAKGGAAPAPGAAPAAPAPATPAAPAGK